MDALYVLLDIIQAPPSHWSAEGDAGGPPRTKHLRKRGSFSAASACVLGYLALHSSSLLLKFKNLNLFLIRWLKSHQQQKTLEISIGDKRAGVGGGFIAFASPRRFCPWCLTSS